MAEFRITWRYIARHLPVITVECDRCGRTGRYHTAQLLDRYGDTDIEQFQRDLTTDCPRNSPMIELGNRCAPMVPALRQLPCNQPR